MEEPRNIAAVFFDMDGTLIDSELNTEPAVQDVCDELGLVKPDLDYTRFYGMTWPSTVQLVAEAYPEFAQVPDLAQRFHNRFHELCAINLPPPIAGAREAIAAVSALVPVAIVSSAYRESIEQTIQQLGIAAQITCYVGAEDFSASKPAPDCFLHAASLVDVEPARCLVFEDSIAGLQAARAAGMTVIAIMHRSNDPAGATAIADIAIRDYSELPDAFYARACAGNE